MRQKLQGPTAHIVVGLFAGLGVLALLVCGYSSWRMNRRDEDAQKEAQRRDSGGGGGPKEPA